MRRTVTPDHLPYQMAEGRKEKIVGQGFSIWRKSRVALVTAMAYLNQIA
ncbi:hypothetical protein H6F98_17990 [Microcoleus sp. FACHB-SPT15]|nr:hypothetical protein [Microcoleus sp. FACHB-SPT15]MBD1807325.1 hypothetical protein [Microcoleus sp. FACHB-SPT15]